MSFVNHPWFSILGIVVCSIGVLCRVGCDHSCGRPNRTTARVLVAAFLLVAAIGYAYRLGKMQNSSLHDAISSAR